MIVGAEARAEPVVTLYEQGRVTHAGSVDFGALEDQFVTWEPGDPSPDRLDALVWMLIGLLVRGGGSGSVLSLHGGAKPGATTGFR